MDDVLSSGDKVSWRGAWGDEEPKTAKIEGITITEGPYKKGGEEVYSIRHSTLKEGRAVIDLDNGHWAYAHQIAPAGHDPHAWHLRGITK